ncbi:MAG: murein L,D-transpeptidase catalytic domain-containing protein [Niastella sp.]|uniref:murein L,D-transpeptidase catalytic domain-containing protein n=1 Tax=Niastella sp. TaxID=1869183 RepID=UPI003899A80F
MKRILFLSLALFLVFLLTAAAWYYTKLKPGNSSYTVAAISNKEILTRLNGHASSLLAYAKENGYNTSTCFLVDMSVGSGKNRFFVFDLTKNVVVDAGLVAHGRCNKDWLNGRQYGNEVGCGCTSLGRYKIGYPYTGRFGRAYKLYGLDATNSNAFKRFVVLHSYTAVPNDEVDPLPICQSDGCPMVSTAFLQKLGKIIDQSPQPILLYIYDKN